jgi:hypothetical protein
MCAGQSYNQQTDESSVVGNTVRSTYRVLRAEMGRPIPRSVNRDHSGHNARSVKRLSPVKHCRLWWPSNYAAAKATPEVCSTASAGSGTTGVRDHGMFEMLVMEPRRSPSDRARMFQLDWQGFASKSAITSDGEVRCFHSSEEVE